MSDEPRDGKTEPTVNDDELIAYLDGELSESQVRVLESKIAMSRVARERAEQFRKTYELLDYLPSPEPSPEFATRTLTSVLPVQSHASLGSTRWLFASPKWLVPLWCVAACLMIGLGFALQRWATPAPDRPSELNTDELNDGFLTELPLYLGVDDLEFLKELHASGLFDAPSQLTPEEFGVVPVPPTSRELDQLKDLWNSFGEARQSQLQQLHRDLRKLPAEEQAPLRATLQQYASWLARTPPSLTARIFEAAPGKRLDTLADVVVTQRQDELPEQKKLGLKQLTLAEKMEYLKGYYAAQATRQQEWMLAQRQWNEMKALGDMDPWPFGDPVLLPAIDDYIRTAWGIDLQKLEGGMLKRTDLPQECRLSWDEVQELRARRRAATTNNYWLTYGHYLLQLSQEHPTLPRPRKGDPVVRSTQLQQLQLRPTALTGLIVRNRSLYGRWPDFALEVAKNTRYDPRICSQLGPSKPGEMTEPVETFIETTLKPKLTEAQRKKLNSLEGRWPAYPQEMLQLAKVHNLWVPEVMLPGEPYTWKRYYELTLPQRAK